MRKSLSFFLGHFNGAASYTLDPGYVKTAYYSFDLFLNRNYVEYTAVAHQSHDLRSDFCLDNRNFRTPEILGGIFQNHGGKSGFSEFQFLFVNNQHTDSLGNGIHLLFLLGLFFLSFLAQKI